MNMYQGKKIYVCDIEADGLLDTITKIWVLGYGTPKEDGTWDIGTTKSYAAIARLFGNPDNVIVGHNFWTYDVIAVEKVLGIKVRAKIVDTLYLAWYLDPNRMMTGKSYGLADYGEDFGVPKVKVDESEWVGIGQEKEELLEYVLGDDSDITNELIEGYKKLEDSGKKELIDSILKEKAEHQELMNHRVTEDIKINVKLWISQMEKYGELYLGEEHLIESHINFLMSKANTYYRHHENRIRLDTELCNSELERLNGFLEERTDKLATVMPETPVRSKKSCPKIPFKKDGTVSAAGKKWFDMLDEMGLPQDYKGEIEVITKYNPPKPNSPGQIKDWLFSLGWEPRIFKKTFSKTKNDFHQVPQVKNKDGFLCRSVLKLAEENPEIAEYEQVGVLQHRIGLLNGFLKNMQADGTIVADIGGLTNTLRIKHRGLVNLPRPSQPYAENIRACLLPPEGMIMIGSDLSSLESVTRNAFIKPYDPEYVREMEEDPYYDAHLDIALTAKGMSENQVLFYKYIKEKSKNPDIKPEDIAKMSEDFWDFYESVGDINEYHEKLDKERSGWKTVNYSSLYNIGHKSLAKDLGIKEHEAQKMLDAYWERNKSVKEFAESCKVINIGTEMWVVNPLNNYRYSLRKLNDIFSTVNQSAGDYIFTLWYEMLKRKGVKLYLGMHDEIATCCYPEDEEKVVAVLYWAIKKVKDMIPIDMGLDIDHKIGGSYMDVH